MDVLAADDNFTTDFLFASASVGETKPELHGLPSAYGESQTLTVVLEDKILGAELRLFYTVFEECNVITRAVRLTNTGKKPIHIKELMSMQIDLQRGDYTMLTFDGAWIRERYKHEHKLQPGVTSFGSITGASSNRHNPFFAIKCGDCSELRGECYGFNLVYSGNHIARAEVSTHGLVRIQNGINPFEFDWLLEPGKEFDTPESEPHRMAYKVEITEVADVNGDGTIDLKDSRLIFRRSPSRILWVTHASATAGLRMAATCD